jgi:hypothetical protein
MEILPFLIGGFIGLPLAAVALRPLRRELRPGWRRRVVMSIVFALLASPAVFFGHGVGLAPALLLLFLPPGEGLVSDYYESILFGLIPILATAVICFLVSSMVAGVRSLVRSGQTPARWQFSQAREHRALQLSLALATLLVVSAFAIRWYLMEFRYTYGPFETRVQTDGEPLGDILVRISPDTLETYFPYRSNQPTTRADRVVRTGQPVVIPAQALGPGITTLTLNVFVWHPLLQWDFTTRVTVPVRPHTRVVIPPIHVPRWSDADLLEILAGRRKPDYPFEEGTGGGDSVSRVVEDRFLRLSLAWGPRFCAPQAHERVRRDYLPPLALAWTKVVLGNMRATPSPELLQILERDLDQACAKPASH